MTTNCNLHPSLKAVGAVLVALSVGCDLPTSPDTPTSSITTSGATAVSSTPRTFAAHAGVPFTGKLEGVVDVTFPDPLSLAVFIQATGTAAQLGRFTIEIPHLVDLTTGIGTGTYEFTAANGDKLTATFTGQGSPTDIPGVVSIVENATITGGTGRFANASGEFIALRSFDFATNLTTGSLAGTISIPAAGRN
jgi:hypothetical protein